MTVTVRRAVEDDLRKVYLLLRDSTLNSAWIPFEWRRRMFQPVWGGQEGYYGYVMEDGDEVVGFLGTLFTEREVAGKPHKFCEIHSWYVKEDYRNESMKLFLPVMSVRKATLLNYTPTQTVYDISKKFGWEDLETKVRQFLPVPTARGLGRGLRVETRKHVIAQHLDEADRKVFLDHEDLRCRHFLITRKGSTDYLYVVVKKLRLGRFVPFGRILYASDPAKLLAAIDHLRLAWCLRLGLAFVVMDDGALQGAIRAAGREPSFTRVVTREVPSLFKSKDLDPDDLRSALYTLPLLIGYRLH
ncbi:GNAT family N-acetyltransferase [Kitasatospora sp. NPDC093806]|uniref:GNAT family N-acetyltransferase n=1 Tax=Kitasatospora sp. NPDC093806 TaxID=3155075 RepID=UPI003442AA32